jgi:ADP-heptose:LPS heptosyltransferase
MLVPTLRALRSGYAGSPIHLCGPAGAAEALLSAGLIESFSGADSPDLAPLATGVADRRLMKALRDPDLVIAYASDTQRASQALGALEMESLVATPNAPAGRHAAEHLLRSLEPLGLPTNWDGPETVAPIQVAGHHSSSGRIVIHPGSGSAWKCAPAALFKEVALALQTAGRRVVLLHGPADSASVAAMDWEGEMIRPTTAMELAYELLASDALIGNDSGVSHLAGLLGMPTVAIFGPTHPDTWRPLGPRVSVVRTCTKPPATAMRVCEDPDCFRDISSAVVVDAMLALLANTENTEVAR